VTSTLLERSLAIPRGASIRVCVTDWPLPRSAPLPDDRVDVSRGHLLAVEPTRADRDHTHADCLLRVLVFVGDDDVAGAVGGDANRVDPFRADCGHAIAQRLAAADTQGDVVGSTRTSR
jgi:hypothetical protein